MKKIILVLMTVLLLAGCQSEQTDDDDIVITSDGYSIVLSDDKASIDGEEIKEYDYSWHISPEKEEAWYEGEEPSGDIYIAHDVVYYPELNEENFVKEQYDDETEWTYHYENEEWFHGESLGEMIDAVKAKAHSGSHKFTNGFLEKVEAVQQRHTNVESFVKRFPTLKSTVYKSEIEHIKSVLKHKQK